MGLIKSIESNSKSTNTNGVRIAFIVGHTKLKPGVKNFQEYPENKFHKMIADNYLCNYDIYYHDSYNMGYTAMCNRTAKRVADEEAKNGKYDLIFLLHFNSAESPQANGAEIWHYFSNEKAKEIGRLYLRKICKQFDITNRGIKALYNRKQRGFAMVGGLDSTAILLEPFFSSNKNESAKFTVENYGQFLENFVDNLYL